MSFESGNRNLLIPLMPKGVEHWQLIWEETQGIECNYL